MAAADRGGTAPDHYQLLGVPREASREEIAQAWRRLARTEHPDSRSGEAGEAAPARFRALAEAWHVLGDPARRAAYDRTLEGQQPAPAITAPPVRIPVRHLAGPGRAADASPLARASRAQLRAGPVRVEGGHPVPGGRDDEEIRLAVLAELAWRYLAGEWPW
jgi:curved DNA-binding protein CbpA